MQFIISNLQFILSVIDPVIAAYKACPPYGTRTRYLSLSLPVCYPMRYRLQYTALIAAYKACPPYGTRTRYLLLSLPVCYPMRYRPPPPTTNRKMHFIVRQLIDVPDYPISRYQVVKSVDKPKRLSQSIKQVTWSSQSLTLQVSR